MITPVGILVTSVPLALVQSPLAPGNGSVSVCSGTAEAVVADLALEYSATAARACRSWACNLEGSIPLRRALRSWLDICRISPLACCRSVVSTSPGGANAANSCTLSTRLRSSPRKSSRVCCGYWPDGTCSPGFGASATATGALVAAGREIFELTARKGCARPIARHTATTIARSLVLMLSSCCDDLLRLIRSQEINQLKLNYGGV